MLPDDDLERSLLEDEDVFGIVLRLTDFMRDCGQPGEVQMAALLVFTAYLVTQCDDPTEGARIAQHGLAREIKLYMASGGNRDA